MKILKSLTQQMKADIQAFQLVYLSSFNFEYSQSYTRFSNVSEKQIFLQGTVLWKVTSNPGLVTLLCGCLTRSYPLINSKKVIYVFCLPSWHNYEKYSFLSNLPKSGFQLMNQLQIYFGEKSLKVVLLMWLVFSNQFL